MSDQDVLITGLGIVSPIGVGAAAVWESLESRRSGVRNIPELAEAGWIAPFGGLIDDFNPKEHVKPRKSLKVMAREIQIGYAAAELARESAGIEEGQIDPERQGVVAGAGMLYCDCEELAAPFRASMAGHAFDFERWGKEGLGEMYPLWLLKYLPNMTACHVGIRQDARGPTNTIAHGDVSSLLALGEAADVIRRGGADVMLAGGSGSRLDLTDLSWRSGAGLTLKGDDPAAASRPFDATRDGSVCGEGAAFFVLESARHAARRQAKVLGRVAAVANRYEATTAGRKPPGKAIAAAIAAAMERAGLKGEDLAMVKAHGASRLDEDAAEAQAIRARVGDAPVTAPTSFFGRTGAGCGAVELAAALIARNQGVTPATLNFATADPECPVSVSAEHRPAESGAILALNHTVTGQAAAAVIAVD
ncbi:3-oxoacyl-[acyl-carrier-protein] synthase 2 [Pseudobythopirellula maris]|uniref:3-oxoacyl-[acyl-carrier-protein] synthase 2 n=1 Tax=Pseudobythopirellula maris TaxID=2527991 RepID=A0A5C5ZLY0_9BACT|nr:beta-ketoacyl synthase N-terminal-like domain-containing protein [Pseudobythopirellula maris]TWT88150.1 3-oxoacyl-[acyl-carrier-protein] synthase 2 [Pseudobythopirellula maris]